MCLSIGRSGFHPDLPMRLVDGMESRPILVKDQKFRFPFALRYFSLKKQRCERGAGL
jgi:hypothetical protein